MGFTIRGARRFLGGAATEVETSQLFRDLEKFIKPSLVASLAAEESSENRYYIRNTIMGYDLPNQNGDAVGRRYAESFGPSFMGKQINVNHQPVPEQIVGKCLFTYHRSVPFQSVSGAELIIGRSVLPGLEGIQGVEEIQVEGVGYIDTSTFLGADMARKLRSKIISMFSQEAHTEYSLCSVCAQKFLNPQQPVCAHLQPGSKMIRAYSADGSAHPILAFRDHHNPTGLGYAIVTVGAYSKANLLQLAEAIKAGKEDPRTLLSKLEYEQSVYGIREEQLDARHTLENLCGHRLQASLAPVETAGLSAQLSDIELRTKLRAAVGDYQKNRTIESFRVLRFYGAEHGKRTGIQGGLVREIEDASINALPRLEISLPATKSAPAAKFTVVAEQLGDTFTWMPEKLEASQESFFVEAALPLLGNSLAYLPGISGGLYRFFEAASVKEGRYHSKVKAKVKAAPIIKNKKPDPTGAKDKCEECGGISTGPLMPQPDGYHRVCRFCAKEMYPKEWAYYEKNGWYPRTEEELESGELKQASEGGKPIIASEKPKQGWVSYGINTKGIPDWIHADGSQSNLSASKEGMPPYGRMEAAEDIAWNPESLKAELITTGVVRWRIEADGWEDRAIEMPVIALAAGVSLLDPAPIGIRAAVSSKTLGGYMSSPLFGKRMLRSIALRGAAAFKESAASILKAYNTAAEEAERRKAEDVEKARLRHENENNEVTNPPISEALVPRQSGAGTITSADVEPPFPTGYAKNDIGPKVHRLLGIAQAAAKAFLEKPSDEMASNIRHAVIAVDLACPDSNIDSQVPGANAWIQWALGLPKRVPAMAAAIRAGESQAEQYEKLLFSDEDAAKKFLSENMSAKNTSLKIDDDNYEDVLYYLFRDGSVVGAYADDIVAYPDFDEFRKDFGKMKQQWDEDIAPQPDVEGGTPTAVSTKPRAAGADKRVFEIRSGSGAEMRRDEVSGLHDLKSKLGEMRPHASVHVFMQWMRKDGAETWVELVKGTPESILKNWMDSSFGDAEKAMNAALRLRAMPEGSASHEVRVFIPKDKAGDLQKIRDWCVREETAYNERELPYVNEIAVEFLDQVDGKAQNPLERDLLRLADSLGLTVRTGSFAHAYNMHMVETLAASDDLRIQAYLGFLQGGLNVGQAMAAVGNPQALFIYGESDSISLEDEKIADDLMLAFSDALDEIPNPPGGRHRGTMEDNRQKLEADIKKFWSGKPLSPGVYSILENENYHFLNEVLEKLGAYPKIASSLEEDTAASRHPGSAGEDEDWMKCGLVAKVSTEAREWISKKIAKLRDEGKSAAQSAAIAYSMARKRGFEAKFIASENVDKFKSEFLEAVTQQFKRWIAGGDGIERIAMDAVSANTERLNSIIKDIVSDNEGVGGDSSLDADRELDSYFQPLARMLDDYLKKEYPAVRAKLDIEGTRFHAAIQLFAGKADWRDESDAMYRIYSLYAPAGNKIGEVRQAKPEFDDAGNKVSWETQWGWSFRRGPQQANGKARNLTEAKAIVEDPMNPKNSGKVIHSYSDLSEMGIIAYGDVRGAVGDAVVAGMFVVPIQAPRILGFGSNQGVLDFAAMKTMEAFSRLALESGGRLISEAGSVYAAFKDPNKLSQWQAALQNADAVMSANIQAEWGDAILFSMPESLEALRNEIVADLMSASTGDPLASSLPDLKASIQGFMAQNPAVLVLEADVFKAALDCVGDAFSTASRLPQIESEFLASIPTQVEAARNTETEAILAKDLLASLSATPQPYKNGDALDSECGRGVVVNADPNGILVDWARAHGRAAYDYVASREFKALGISANNESRSPSLEAMSISGEFQRCPGCTQGIQASEPNWGGYCVRCASLRGAMEVKAGLESGQAHAVAAMLSESFSAGDARYQADGAWLIGRPNTPEIKVSVSADGRRNLTMLGKTFTLADPHPGAWMQSIKLSASAQSVAQLMAWLQASPMWAEASSRGQYVIAEDPKTGKPLEAPEDFISLHKKLKDAGIKTYKGSGIHYPDLYTEDVPEAHKIIEEHSQGKKFPITVDKFKSDHPDDKGKAMLNIPFMYDKKEGVEASLQAAKGPEIEVVGASSQGQYVIYVDHMSNDSEADNLGAADRLADHLQKLFPRVDVVVKNGVSGVGAGWQGYDEDGIGEEMDLAAEDFDCWAPATPEKADGVTTEAKVSKTKPKIMTREYPHDVIESRLAAARIEWSLLRGKMASAAHARIEAALMVSVDSKDLDAAMIEADAVLKASGIELTLSAALGPTYEVGTDPTGIGPGHGQMEEGVGVTQMPEPDPELLNNDRLPDATLRLRDTEVNTINYAKTTGSGRIH
jgi:hypothetical protein